MARTPLTLLLGSEKALSADKEFARPNNKKHKKADVDNILDFKSHSPEVYLDQFTIGRRKKSARVSIESLVTHNYAKRKGF